MKSERIVLGRRRQKFTDVSEGYSQVSETPRVRALTWDEAANEAFRGSVVIPELERLREEWELSQERRIARMRKSFRRQLRRLTRR